MTVTQSFAAAPEAVAPARRFVQAALRGEGPDVVEPATLIVSELATNAVLHARSRFDVAVTTDDGRIRIEVTDFGSGAPEVGELRPTAPGGRGLRIVGALADEWGWADQDGRKTVWCLLTRPRDGTTSGAPATRAS